ncbi:MAG: hypothetical protein WC284_11785 [Candidimonas sp.]
MNTLLTDVDGVLLDWVGGFERYARELYDTNHSMGEKTVSEWLRCTETEEHHIVTNFHQHEKFSQLDAYDDAVDILKSLHYHGWTIIAITACGDDPQTKQLRQSNLQKHFGDIFDDLICTPVHGSKDEALKKFSPSYWVDDMHHHVISGRKHGHHSFHMNRNGSDIIDWYDIAIRVF